MAWIMDTISMHRGHTVAGVVTGKPVAVGGTLGRSEATGRGLLFIAREVARANRTSLQGATVAVQGFGKVGATAARLLHEEGAKVVAVSDAQSAIYNGAGLDIRALMPYREDTQPLSEARAGDNITNAELLALDVDFLVPAALEGQLTADNAEDVRARFIDRRRQRAHHAGRRRDLRRTQASRVVPDILANAGGVIVSYFEWVQDLQFYFWDETEVNDKLHKVITRAYADVVAAAEEHNCTLREAAMVLAVGRVAEAARLRGIYP